MASDNPSVKNDGFVSARRSVTFHPSIWGDHFLTYTSDLTQIQGHEQEELEKQKEEVRKQLQTDDDSMKKLELIDAIQRLEVAHHFTQEIEKSLKYIHDTYNDYNDLHTVAFLFRLLRQQGHCISSVVGYLWFETDVFNEFKDRDGKFKESMINNVQGMISLYEAAHFGVNGKEILDEALEFSSAHLQSMGDHVSDSLATQINEALKMPIHKSLTRLDAKIFMSMYQKDESHNETLLHFAKLDFNNLQKMHQEELCEITRWWKKGLDFENKLAFTRNRVAESYFWALAIHFEPQYRLARRLLTKVIAMISIMMIFMTWGSSALETLPPYMKLCYQALLDVYAEMEDEMKTLGTSYRMYYAQEEMKKLVKAYFQKAKCLCNNYIPTMEEYMMVGLVSSTYMVLPTTSLVGMGSLVTKETFEWISNEPLIIRASSAIGFETKSSAVECYMKQNGASKEEAFGEIQKTIKKAWKDINQEFLHPTTMPIPILLRIINNARMTDLVYAYEDEVAWSDAGNTFGICDVRDDSLNPRKTDAGRCLMRLKIKADLHQSLTLNRDEIDCGIARSDRLGGGAKGVTWSDSEGHRK
ncbi:hypothetical protein BUALT_Bualt02G0032200 [Buddleja alternifolia]|uniref:Uncharacterized protein n=1 Tax=Buddleja alternifolia TaxID=168488 RepID=A0AAV6Y470_9LAMI|nr:hypothetical protein BUALT_Bualt02G0032200 [Buddleja alternifolia]